VRARQDLVKAYRSAGDRGSAERVKLARKPTRAAWTVNQLARQEKAGVRSLLNAGKRLRAAQQKALGGGSGSALRKATDEERETLRPLVDAARFESSRPMMRKRPRRPCFRSSERCMPLPETKNSLRSSAAAG
jgi:hypothetical protein